MKKAFLIIALFLLLTVIIHSSSAPLNAAPASPRAATPVDPVVPGVGIITSRNMENGRVSTSNLAVFGPQICSRFGDPYSPQFPTWPGNDGLYDGLYSYRYRIRIPADYPEDSVRVELFDPDSINQPNNDGDSHTENVIHTAVWNTEFPGSEVEALNCFEPFGNAPPQRDPCLIDTQEDELLGLPIDQVNPWWFVRIDENRGTGLPPGNGACGYPSIYDAEYNTVTRYQLSYFTQQTDGSATEILLAQYSGQCDCSRDVDATNHDTDMRWVTPDDPTSPHSNLSIDQTIFVPTDSGIGTTESFLVDLTTDVPNIFTDPISGDRYLYLDVRTLSGASENGYEIWAGPPDYLDDGIPSNVNLRNVQILDNPGSHDSAGVEVLAIDTLLDNSNFSSYSNPISNSLSIPLTTIGAELAGSTISIRLFDPDTGAQPPIVFFFDTIAFTPDSTNPLGYDPAVTDWAMAFSVAGQDDPDGVEEGVRCVPGSCQDEWIDPAYQITVPGDLSSCDWENPTSETCTPFYGGRLMAQYIGGFTDTYAWELEIIPASPPDSNAGCSAFPIAPGAGTRSVTTLGAGGNPYPDAADFDYPASPPAFSSFADHVEDVPLTAAVPGTLYKLNNGFGNSDFGWLVWNEGIAATATTLGNSLSWPGDSTDYTDHGDGGTAVPSSGYANVVRGYIEPGDPSDQTLHMYDWIAASTGSISSTEVTDALNAHIDLGGTLRLPIWDNSEGSGANGRYQTSQFGIFRLIGYSISDNWLLLEYVDDDTSCGQAPQPPSTTDSLLYLPLIAK